MSFFRGLECRIEGHMDENALFDESLDRARGAAMFFDNERRFGDAEKRVLAPGRAR